MFKLKSGLTSWFQYAFQDLRPEMQKEVYYTHFSFGKRKVRQKKKTASQGLRPEMLLTHLGPYGPRCVYTSGLTAWGVKKKNTHLRAYALRCFKSVGPHGPGRKSWTMLVPFGQNKWTNPSWSTSGHHTIQHISAKCSQILLWRDSGDFPLAIYG